jgi:hypothetical protein
VWKAILGLVESMFFPVATPIQSCQHLSALGAQRFVQVGDVALHLQDRLVSQIALFSWLNYSKSPFAYLVE